MLPALLLVCPAAPLPGQVLTAGTGPDGRVRVHTSDLAIFLAGEERKDLPCSVSPNRPVLGFDLRFHAGYEVAVPLRELAGNEDVLSILFRVLPREEAAEPVYFSQRVRVPAIEEDARGDAYLHGSFDIGEGGYDVEWLMRDRSGRICASFWDIEARLGGRDREIGLEIRAGEVRPSEAEQFREEPPVLRASDGVPLKVKMLVNFAPQNVHSATLQPHDTSALVAILRTISREPRIGKFSLVAFNLQEQRILYRQDEVDRIDFRALGESLDTMELGTIDLERLSDKHGETAFLTELIRQEAPDAGGTDALILAGPKAMLSRELPDEELRDLVGPGYPVFYMNYNLFPSQVPWRDTIGAAVRVLKGREFTISRPRDLWFAVSEMVSQIVRTKEGRRPDAASSD
jgi:hypothetical protein